MSAGSSECDRVEFILRSLEMILGCARGDHPTWLEAMPTETQCRIERHVGAIREAIQLRAPQSTHLRLIIDNTREVDHG